MSKLEAPSPTSTSSSNATRVDLYAVIHKALRLFMHDTLLRIGRLDTDDATELQVALVQLQSLLDACRSHVAKENAHVHAAIEARRPGASVRVADEHVEHLESIAALEAEAATLRALPSAAAAQRLYRHLAAFIGENLLHMQVEETQHNAALWAAYDDAELMQVHQRIVASIPPVEMASLLRWMLPATTPAERAEMLTGMRQGMPPDAFTGVLELARGALDDAAWAKLVHAIAVPSAADPMSVRGAQ